MYTRRIYYTVTAIPMTLGPTIAGNSRTYTHEEERDYLCLS